MSRAGGVAVLAVLLAAGPDRHDSRRSTRAPDARPASSPSGESPYDNTYSKERLIFHASIGRVYTPTDQPLVGPLELLRDKRWPPGWQTWRLDE